MDTIDVAAKFALVTEQWRPKIIASLNGQEVKVVKVQGVRPCSRRRRIRFRPTIPSGVMAQGCCRCRPADTYYGGIRDWGLEVGNGGDAVIQERPPIDAPYLGACPAPASENPAALSA